MKIGFYSLIRPTFPSNCIRWADPIHYFGGGLSNYDLHFHATLEADDDVWVFCRNLPDTEKLDELKAKGKVMIYDCDDPLWLTGKPLNLRKRLAKQIEQLDKWFDYAVCSTQGLADELRKANSKIPIVVLPNYLPIHKREPIANVDKAVIYTGCTMDKLKMLAKPFMNACKLLQKKGWKIISSVPIEGCNVEGLPNVDYPYFHSMLLPQLNGVYVAPLVDCVESRCKSDLKQQEALAMGLPFVGMGDPYVDSLPYDASYKEIAAAIESAKVPSCEYREYDYDFRGIWASVYSGKITPKS